MDGNDAGKMALEIAEGLGKGLGSKEPGEKPNKTPKSKIAKADNALSEQWANRCAADASKARTLMGILRGAKLSEALVQDLEEQCKSLARLEPMFREATTTADPHQLKDLMAEAQPLLHSVKINIKAGNSIKTGSTGKDKLLGLEGSKSFRPQSTGKNKL